MEPYLTSYLTLPSRSIAAMLMMKPVILAAHRDPREGETRVTALEEALRRVKAHEIAEAKRIADREHERREKRARFRTPTRKGR